MAGHSKWSKVKHIEGPLDAGRGAAFSKLVKQITVAARIGDGGPSGNPRLRSVVETARAASVSARNIEGTHDGKTFYKAHAPGGVAILSEAATDHTSRTAADLRFTLSKNQASFAARGSVLSMFHQQGRVTVPRSLGEDAHAPARLPA